MRGKRELKWTATVRRGARGKAARRIQEWLSLQGLNVAIDGDFGPATAFAVRQFQRKCGVNDDGVVGKTTWTELVEPMTRALEEIDPGSRSLSRLVVAYAKQHLKQHPREVGGQNRGPWVRLYMSGNEGANWPWCAGFVSFILEQACETAGVELPIETSFSCDWMAASAMEQGLFLEGRSLDAESELRPGAIFLNRRTSTDWVHTGFVTKSDDDVFQTIEGNTNDEGSREGYEVCARVRGYRSKDFISTW